MNAFVSLSEQKTSCLFLLFAGRIKCGNSEIPRILPNGGNAAAYGTTLAASPAIIIRSFSVFLRISGTFLNEYAKWASHANSPTSVSAATEQEKEEGLLLRRNHRCRIHISFFLTETRCVNSSLYLSKIYRGKMVIHCSIIYSFPN